ncbi:MAG: hypothetical protein Q9165_000271 [Trypethelium subeluteriae]
MTEQWQQPGLRASGRFTHLWNLRTFSTPPPNLTDYLKPEGDDYDSAVASAGKMSACRPADFEPWRWVVRLFVHNILWQPSEKGKPINPGVKLKSGWSTSTAWFAAAAHAPGDNGKWLLTAAHNIFSVVPPHDENGNVTRMDGSQHARADAIFVLATWGPKIFTGWVSKAAAMKGYAENKDDHRCDGAALHIHESKIPASWWERAPTITSLPSSMADPPAIYQLHFVVAGYPGSINQYPDMSGFYLGGRRVAPGQAITRDNFQKVVITKKNPTALVGGDNGTLTFDEIQVVTAPGMSGSPGVAWVPTVEAPIVVGSHHTSGTAAGFIKLADGDAVAVGVDPKVLLNAIGAEDLAWEDWNAPDALGRLRVLRWAMR